MPHMMAVVGARTHNTESMPVRTCLRVDISCPPPQPTHPPHTAPPTRNGEWPHGRSSHDHSTTTDRRPASRVLACTCQDATNMQRASSSSPFTSGLQTSVYLVPTRPPSPRARERVHSGLPWNHISAPERTRAVGRRAAVLRAAKVRGSRSEQAEKPVFMYSPSETDGAPELGSGCQHPAEQANRHPRYPQLD